MVRSRHKLTFALFAAGLISVRCATLNPVRAPASSVIPPCESLFLGQTRYAIDGFFTLERLQDEIIDFNPNAILHFADGMKIPIFLKPETTRTDVVDFELYESKTPQDPLSLEHDRDPRVNCHAYACMASKLPGLPEKFWLNSHKETSSPSNVLTLLDKFYVPVLSASVTMHRSITYSNALREGDFITFFDKDGLNLHSGVIVQKRMNGETQFWIRHKLGKSGVYESPAIEIRTFYEYQTYKVFRLNLNDKLLGILKDAELSATLSERHLPLIAHLLKSTDLPSEKFYELGKWIIKLWPAAAKLRPAMIDALFLHKNDGDTVYRISNAILESGGTLTPEERETFTRRLEAEPDPGQMARGLFILRPDVR